MTDSQWHPLATLLTNPTDKCGDAHWVSRVPMIFPESGGYE